MQKIHPRPVRVIWPYDLVTSMVNTKVTIIAVAAVAAVTIIGCVIAFNGEGHNSDSGTFIFSWGPGTSMSYDVGGGFTHSDSGYDAIYSLEGSTERHEITSATESQFTFQRDAMIRETHTDPSTGETETETRHVTTTVDQDREFKYSDAMVSTMDTKWGTKNVLVIKSVVTNAYGSKIDVTDYRDADTFIRYKADMTCDSYISGSDTFNDWHMTYTLTDYNIVESE